MTGLWLCRDDDRRSQDFDRSELDRDQQRLLLTPPSRTGSRATLASLGSFSLNPIASPALREANDVTGVASNPVRGVASVLDGFDPSFLSQVNGCLVSSVLSFDLFWSMLGIEPEVAQMILSAFVAYLDCLVIQLPKISLCLHELENTL